MERIHDVSELLKTGIEMMMTGGYHNTSINAIIKEAKLPKGSFYYLYKDKKTFALDALRNYNDGLIDSFVELASNASYTPMEAIQTFFQQSIDSLKATNYSNGCFLGNMGQEMSNIDEDFRAVILDGFDRLRDALSLQLKRAQTTGEFDPAADTAVFAELIIHAYHGALLRMKSTRSRQPLDIFMNDFFSLMACNV